MTKMRIAFFIASALVPLLLTNCASPSSSISMQGPSVSERNASIANEPAGNYYIGRRYYVEKTRFWGYVRKPQQPWSSAKLVMLNESQKYAPDRLPEDGPTGSRYGHDTNYEYKLYGKYTGQSAYDPNSNQILPEFKLTGYELLKKDSGWLFTPKDRYDPVAITIYP